MIDRDAITNFIHQLWQTDLRGLRGLPRLRVLTLRTCYAVTRDVFAGQINLRAMSLVYTTLLSLVPMLAVSFSVLKAFGVHNEVKPIMYNFLAPLGEKGVEVGDRIIGFVENIQVGVLGSVGLALLLYMVISLLQKIERAFNHIWRVEHPRGFARRFSDYLSVILVGPVLVFTAIAITASVKTALLAQAGDIQYLSEGVEFAGKFVPYLLIITAFTFVYIFMPNTKVRFFPAFIGALLAGFLWESLGWGFASFVVSSARYAAIYSGFAILILFMIWLYLGWVILLIGADVSFYVQNPLQLTAPGTNLNLSRRDETRLTLAVMLYVGEAFHRGEQAPDIESLCLRTGVAQGIMADAVHYLVETDLLRETSGEHHGLVPARDMENILVRDILDTLDARHTLQLPRTRHDRQIEGLLKNLSDCRDEMLQEQNLKQFVSLHEHEA
ncbi:MAG: YihY/virulence factor BrkB family protein [Granulosicoccaceae bacterium]|jgi:membrane protein